MKPKKIDALVEAGTIILDESNFQNNKKTVLWKSSEISRLQRPRFSLKDDKVETLDYQSSQNSKAESFSNPLAKFIISPPVFNRKPKKLDHNWDVRQKWEGWVVSVEEESFKCHLQDLTDIDNPREEAIIPFSEVSREDLDLISEGAVFYWYIGYEDSPKGRTRFSFIRFRRLPAWSKSDFDRAEKLASEYYELLNPENIRAKERRN